MSGDPLLVLRALVADALAGLLPSTFPALALPAPAGGALPAGRWLTTADDGFAAGPAEALSPLPGATTAGTSAAASFGDPLDAHGARMAALVELAQGGDSEAFAAIYDAYVDSIYRYISFRVGDHALAEDLTSETFLRALRRLPSFTWQGRDIGAWFVTIARNLVTDHYKSGRNRYELVSDEISDHDRADDGIEDGVVSALDNADLLAAVTSLKDEQRECVVLRFLQGLSIAETALVMGRSEGAVKQLQLRAVRALARAVEGRL
ncbi:MAG: sigma-70 family RNA polymerase sigma factor [Actinomycetes bacterium]